MECPDSVRDGEGGDGNAAVSALGGSVMGTVTTEVGNAMFLPPGRSRKLLMQLEICQVYAIEGITSPTIKAGGDANVMTYENIKSDATTTGGNIWVDAGTDVDGKVDAQLNAIVRSRTTTISKDVVSEAADATAIALDSLSANVTAYRDAVAVSRKDIAGNVSAGRNAMALCVGGNVSGNVERGR